MRAARQHQQKTFAAGLTLPLNFPLGDQKALAFNRQAGPNTISDYIPSPHLQYHFNANTYLQTEIQFSSPQFIRPLLLSQYKQTIPFSNSYISNSIYANKLYYFNIPLVIHHSPFPNFFVGTGVQFSSLLSGIALSEKKQYWNGNPSAMMVRQEYSKFSNDSLSGKFNNNEFRMLVDMNYYWNRFTIGFRYNQAFTNYVDYRLPSTSGFTRDKNKALLFYLRYNIWENRKKTQKDSYLTFK